MTNPCRRHFQRVTAAKEAAAVEPTQTMAGATAYEHQLNQLLQDRLRLKQVQSNQGKAELKRQLLPEYIPYVQGVLDAGQGAQDEVLTTIMVWRFDAGDFTGGLDIAQYVLQHKMVMPDRFARTLGCLVAEEVATAAFKAQKVGEPFDLAVLHRTAELTDAEDMPDQARAKLFLAMGRATVEGLTDDQPGQPGQVQAGIDLLKKAIDLHDACGGKKDLERAERLLNKLAAAGS
ncbi:MULTISPECIES: phage terminase small subunit [unclassified Pseudomonas]|uniref:phage terminase small subunit n=1 Tax=unclassified Pseudomonas TaxID=196821 RepID=UPI00215C2715|nr:MULTISPECIES: terminase endonuclease subunit [unclassified Pseudomonas]MCR8930417.1 terminase endonuclease subunit [Pseudomonas sp. S11A4]MCR8935632.1 terminase endonuclease subunit [Pseudomonas sp. S11A4]MCR8935715.1 terminase endonuclease subunit [Pseudomonas sp. S11A4]MCR8974019.1 terminase endonuclease subunit [Pseudomonas sp. S11P7]